MLREDARPAVEDQSRPHVEAVKVALDTRYREILKAFASWFYQSVWLTPAGDMVASDVGRRHPHRGSTSSGCCPVAIDKIVPTSFPHLGLSLSPVARAARQIYTG